MVVETSFFSQDPQPASSLILGATSTVVPIIATGDCQGVEARDKAGNKSGNTYKDFFSTEHFSFKTLTCRGENQTLLSELEFSDKRSLDLRNCTWFEIGFCGNSKTSNHTIRNEFQSKDLCFDRSRNCINDREKGNCSGRQLSRRFFEPSLSSRKKREV